MGWEVEVADAQKVKGLAPLTCKTDKIDAWVLAKLSRRELVPAIWLPAFQQRAERERTLAAVLAAQALLAEASRACAAARLRSPMPGFGPLRPRRPKAAFTAAVPRALALRVLAALQTIEDLDAQIMGIDRELKGLGADHRYVPLLMSVPVIAWVLGYTIAAEIGDIRRFATPRKLCGYTGLCPRVYQSGAKDRRGQLTHAGPKYLRWALMEGATHACRHPVYRERYQRNKRRLGKQRGAKVAQVDIARRLAEAIWHMLTREQPFAPAGATSALAA